MFSPVRSRCTATLAGLRTLIQAGGWSHNFYRIGRGDVVVGLQIASGAVRKVVQILDFIPRVALDKSSAHAVISPS